MKRNGGGKRGNQLNMAGSSINLPAPAVAVCAGIDVIGLIALVATTWMRWGGR